VIVRLLVNSGYFTWSFEKMRAVFEYWQAGVIERKDKGIIF
jgi:hypothetical protein